MNNFSVSPDYCLTLRAIRETSSLREAAALLIMDPAHLSRKLQRISEEHDLLQKISNRWVLSEAGLRLCQWVDESILLQQSLLDQKPVLRISSFTWLAEQVLIPAYQRLNEVTKEKFSWRFGIVASDLESELVSGRSDYAITCHPPHDPLIAHKVFSYDPWVIVIPKSWAKELRSVKKEDLRAYLNRKPYLRLTDLNPDQVLGFQPAMISEFMVDGVIGLRAGVLNGIGWSCLPTYSIMTQLRNKELLTIDLESATKGQLSIWWLRSRKDLFTQVKPLSSWLRELSIIASHKTGEPQ